MIFLFFKPSVALLEAELAPFKFRFLKCCQFLPNLLKNVESYKKVNEKAQTANFSDLTRQRQELCAGNAKKHKN